MAYPRRYIIIFAAFVLLVVVYLFLRSLHTGPASPKLSVVFIGMTNNPKRTMTPIRVAICGGATGLCAMLMVSNTSTDQNLWFKTTSVEQQTETGWQPFIPSNSSWFGVEGGDWSPRYGCLVAVGWPPGLATNASWRLQVRYGREQSSLGIILNQKIGRKLFPPGLIPFHRGKEESTVQSSEVKQ